MSAVVIFGRHAALAGAAARAAAAVLIVTEDGAEVVTDYPYDLAP